MTSPRLRDAIQHIQFARWYTLRLLDTIDPADWFRMPAGGVTHVGWQVAHLAMAEYRLCLLRVRGPRPEDEELIPPRFQALGRGDPEPDPAQNPSPAELRAVLDRVHERVLTDLPALAESELDAPLAVEHPIAKTKIEALRWCAAHELVHAGQVALLRRLFGQKPIW